MYRCDECTHRGACIRVPYGCECYELDMAEHDSKVRADERNKIIAKIKVGLGKIKTFDIDTTSEHREIRYYDAKKVLEVLGDILNQE